MYVRSITPLRQSFERRTRTIFPNQPTHTLKGPRSDSKYPRTLTTRRPPHYRRCARTPISSDLPVLVACVGPSWARNRGRVNLAGITKLPSYLPYLAFHPGKSSRICRKQDKINNNPHPDLGNYLQSLCYVYLLSFPFRSYVCTQYLFLHLGRGNSFFSGTRQDKRK